MTVHVIITISMPYIPSHTHTHTPDAPMSSAQVILNSLNGLFQISETATLHMLEMMENIDIPETWENVDLIKQTEGLMVRGAYSTTTDCDCP